MCSLQHKLTSFPSLDCYTITSSILLVIHKNAKKQLQGFLFILYVGIRVNTYFLKHVCGGQGQGARGLKTYIHGIALLRELDMLARPLGRLVHGFGLPFFFGCLGTLVLLSRDFASCVLMGVLFTLFVILSQNVAHGNYII